MSYRLNSFKGLYIGLRFRVVNSIKGSIQGLHNWILHGSITRSYKRDTRTLDYS